VRAERAKNYVYTIEDVKHILEQKRALGITNNNPGPTLPPLDFTAPSTPPSSFPLPPSYLIIPQCGFGRSISGRFWLPRSPGTWRRWQS
jgi:hypothetical protein